MDYKSILDTVTTALGVVQGVAAAPGINLLPYVSTIAGAAGTLSAAVDAGRSIGDRIEKFRETFAAPPTPEQLAALDADIAALRAELHAPPPPAEPGEPA